MKYFGWADNQACENDWREYNDKNRIEGFPTDDEVLLASYGGGVYDGDGFVLYQQHGKLYENHGSHCSCYGLEGQWKPEETTWAALALRPRGSDYSAFLYGHGDDARSALYALIDASTKS